MAGPSRSGLFSTLGHRVLPPEPFSLFSSNLRLPECEVSTLQVVYRDEVKPHP